MANAFFAAARSGDFDRLVAVLDPGVVLRADYGKRRAPAPTVRRGPAAVSGLDLAGAKLPDTQLIPVLINGSAGVVITARGRPYSLMGFVVANGRIVVIDAILDSTRVGVLGAAVLR